MKPIDFSCVKIPDIEQIVEKSVSQTEHRLLRIEEQSDRFVLRGSNGEFHWSKGLIDKGNKHTPEEWKAIVKTQEWDVPDIHYWALSVMEIYKIYCSDDRAQRALAMRMKRSWLRDLRHAEILTATEVAHESWSKDIIFYNFSSAGAKECHIPRYVDAYTINALLPYYGLKEAASALLGTDDPYQSNEAFFWFHRGLYLNSNDIFDETQTPPGEREPTVLNIKKLFYPDAMAIEKLILEMGRNQNDIYSCWGIQIKLREGL